MELAAIMAAKAVGSTVLFRGETVVRPRNRSSRESLRWLTMRILSKFVDAFLPIGTRSREFYQRYGIRGDRLFLSPYAVDNESFRLAAVRNRPSRRELRQSMGLSPDIPVVLSVAKMTERKRPLDLFEAMGKIRTPSALVFVGDGPLRGAVLERAASQGRRHVHCVGFQTQEHIPRFYSVADLFVLPSEFEPWGLVINEAMCFGLPVVTTQAVTAAVDLVIPGENGFLYPVGDQGDLAHSIDTLLADETLRTKMGRRSEEIIARWSLSQSVEGIVASLHALSNGRLAA
jgi:glycosyltransferase involved in cell wall biosynthesis